MEEKVNNYAVLLSFFFRVSKNNLFFAISSDFKI